MWGKNSAKVVRDKILEEYYSEVYQKYLFSKDAQGLGNRYFESALEKFWKEKVPVKVLEIGGGSGEHLPYIGYIPAHSYTSVDIRRKFHDSYLEGLNPEFASKVNFVIADAQDLPFADSYFDRVLSTCLLHHVDDVLAVLLEARRVTVTGGEIAFILPTDPGVLNQIVKRLISYPKLRKLSQIRPELFYALDHKNHIGSILELIKYVFSGDSLELHYEPFKLSSWNLNLLVVAKIIKT
jgi:ubiquinone/menaquinone biosynthesis C-methylase UbiE